MNPSRLISEQLSTRFVRPIDRKKLIEALERRGSARPIPADVLLSHALQDPGFAGAWLAHALGSVAGRTELALSLAAAGQVLPDFMIALAAFWTEVATRMSLTVDQELARLEWASIAARHDLTELAESESAFTIWAIVEAAGQQLKPPAASDNPVRLAGLPIAPGYLKIICEMAQPRLQASDVYGQKHKGEQLKQIRDSDQALMDTPTASPLLGSCERLIAAASGIDLACAEPMVILRYSPGQQYRWHRDYIQPSGADVRRELAMFGQRVHTGILYLNEGFEGGETEFRDWQQSFRARAGQCLNFASVDANGQPDPSSIHRGAPVIRGEKWIGTLWFRARRLWSREGLLKEPVSRSV